MVSTKKLPSLEYGILMLLMVYASLEVSEAAFMEDKRAGFVGMRGKKDSPPLNFDDYIDTDSPDLYYEAAKRSGFVGMRGKKDQEDQEDLFYAPNPKRAGFVGMRGKKQVQNYWPSFWYAPAALTHRESRGNSGFVGMRG